MSACWVRQSLTFVYGLISRYMPWWRPFSKPNTELKKKLAFFDGCPIVLCPGPFCFSSVLQKRVDCECQVKCHCNKIPWQPVMHLSNKWTYGGFVLCLIPMGSSLKRMIHCHADDISAWFSAIHCALPTKLVHYFALFKKGNMQAYFYFRFIHA